MLRDVKGAVAWVTGAGTGIGRAAAIMLAENGVRVAISGRSPAPLEETAAAIRKAGGEVVVEPLDVADKAAVAATAKRVAERLGTIDVLVNNAGVNLKDRHLDKLSPEGWDNVVQVNLNGAFYCVHACLPGMRAKGDGVIVNIVSWAGRYPSMVSGGAYTAAKHALLAFNAVVNHEEGMHGIRACGICPGEVATPILDHRPVPVTPEERAKLLQPEDLAEMVLFVVRMPARACINEILTSPTWNRRNIAEVRARQAQSR